MTTTAARPQSSVTGSIRERVVELVNQLGAVAGDEEAVINALRPHYGKPDFEDMLLATLIVTFVESIRPEQETTA